MTRFDPMAFDPPEIKETQHTAMPCTDRATPETTSGNMVNVFDDHPPVGKNPDTSFACFIAGEGCGA